MARSALPVPRTHSGWLDRPIAPAWQRLAGILAHRELLAYGALLMIGFVLRIWDVGARAMHHDESLHAYYAWKLFIGQGYAYDPLTHGPLQFELVPVFYLLFGVGEFAARLLAVVLGTGLIALPYFLRRYLTSPGAVLASLMITVSPALLYYSRFIRDDIYLACFSLILFIALVRYIETHRTGYVYLGAASAALALASMEAAYIVFFIFGTFLAFVALREFLIERTGPVIAAARALSLDTLMTGAAIFIVLTVLFYSTFFTNPDGIWDSHHSLLSPDRRDILGGLTYWKQQHYVQRGGQPWYYYLLLLPLYEQLALVFGVAGAVFAVLRRSFVNSFLVWWAVMALGIFSWAGEKMPWLSIHITLPLILLAALFLGNALAFRRLWAAAATAVVFLLLLLLEVHSAFALSYQDGANPTEMLIYVQTSQDVPNVVREIGSVSKRVAGGNKLAIGLDTNDVGGWPFLWYLRDYPNVFQTATFSGPVCGNQYCPVLLLLQPEYQAYASQLMKHYVATRYRWNWWFPEDYKQWFPDHVGTIPLSLTGHGALSTAPVGTATDWMHLWDWLVYRRPFGYRGARWMYVLVRRDLVPGARYYSTHPIGLTGAPIAPAAIGAVRTLPSKLTTSTSGGGAIAGPGGVAVSRDGSTYVADPANHRVVQFSVSGRVVRSWGGVGKGPGQFSQDESPQAVAVAPNGQVFVADTWNQRIEVFSPTGRFLRQWGGGAIGASPGQFYGPRSVAVAPDGKVYVTDTGNRRIQVFTPEGHLRRVIGSSGTLRGQFQEPSALAIGRGGNLYVADFWNQRIQVLTAAGHFVRSWRVADWSPQSYDEPYLAVDPQNGDLFATDPQEARVLAWTPTGRLIGALGSGQLTLPIGVAVEPNGRVIVTDRTAAKVDTFTVHFTSRP